VRSLSDLTSECIRCGFCLESCPTFVLSGRETESPRGRIYLARTADEGKIEWESTREAFDTCLGCRACEPACPSGVQYGQILEQARSRLGARPGVEGLVDGLSSPAKFRLQVGLAKLWPGTRIPGIVSRRLTDERPEARLPVSERGSNWPHLDDSELPTVVGEVYILEGCVMRVLFPGVHAALRRLLRRVGYVVRESSAGCCGALHAHSGILDGASERVHRLVEAMPGDLPIIVDSAGCGSWMKEQTSLASRVFDASEFLLSHGLLDTLTESPGIPASVTYHDACHLAHGQRIKEAPRRLIQAIPRATYVELSEADMCCGSAGIYNLTQPSRARALLDRKWANIEATGTQIVAMGNPGCHSWIQQAADEAGSKLRVMHTLDLLEASFSGLREQ
jgi:glycolate oxidase iron-sulfur subunit